MGKFWVHLLLLSIAAILSYGLVGVPDVAKAESEPLPTPQTVTITEPNPIVQPTDWAYITLKLVVSKFNWRLSKTNLATTYFLSNIEITRYEFSQVLSDCLDNVNQHLRIEQKQPIITKQDLTALQKLQEEFGAELATRGSLIGIETRIPIQPIDPIYKQLQLAMDEYGCIAGTRNRIYDIGNKELQPAEFVAILKGCLQRVNQLAASGTIKWTRAELEPLAKLELEFYNELYRL